MNKEKLVAYFNNPKIKEKYLKRVRAHAKADEIIKGQYWGDGKGCAVGCTVHSGDLDAYEIELGIPRILARLEDGIFESLPNDLAKTWPERFLKAIKPGADLSKVWNKFAIWLLIDPINGVVNYARTKNTETSINNVANLYLRSLKEEISTTEWRSAAAYAAINDDAATYAAYAADAAINYAAAAYAACAADAATNDDAIAKARIAQSEKLLELLREAE